MNTRRKTKRKPKHKGFTIVEVMITVAVGSLLLIAVLIAVSQLQKHNRDFHRKEYARAVAASLLDFQANNLGEIPNCFGFSTATQCAAAPRQASRFIKNYMPDDDDPSTGEDYRSDTTQAVTNRWCRGEATPDENTVFCWYDQRSFYIEHALMPRLGQILIAASHVCGTNSSTSRYGDRVINDAGSSTTGGNFRTSAAVIIGLESGQYYCVNT